MHRMLMVVSLAAVAAGLILSPPPSLADASYSKSALASDAIKGQQLAQKISAVEVLAPLAPVALSPFFGMTCLSGTSILSNRGVLPENSFLMGSKVLDNGLVFAVFLALSIATSLPKMTAVSKGFAEVTDQLETYSTLITYLVILYLAGLGQDDGTQQVAYTAGVFTLTRDMLLAIAVIINIIVINTVKFFFELLVWISPFPGLDAAFETVNKITTAALVAIYAFNPHLAMWLNVILFLLCLPFFGWAQRRVRYYRAMLVAPLTAKLLGRTGAPLPGYVQSRIASVVDQRRPLVKVFPLQRIRSIKKKEAAYLTIGTEGLCLVKLRWIRRPKVEQLRTAEAHIDITTGLLSNSIEIASQDSPKPTTLAFSKVYNAHIASIAAELKPFGVIRTETGGGDAGAVCPEPA